MKFDLIFSIEGGYEEVEGKYLIVTYVSIIDSNRNEYIGKSNGPEITESMFDWVKSDKSLNKVIETILKNENNKRNNGISGFLTDNIYNIDLFDSYAVQSALLTMNNIQTYNILDEKLITLRN